MATIDPSLDQLQPNLFISFDMHNHMIDFRHLNSWKLHMQNSRGPQNLLAQEHH